MTGVSLRVGQVRVWGRFVRAVVGYRILGSDGCAGDALGRAVFAVGVYICGKKVRLT